MVLRLAVLAVVAAFALWDREVGALQALAALSLIWLIGQVGTGRPGVSAPVLIGVEALTSGVLAAVGTNTELAMLAVLTVPPAVGGLHLGRRGAALALVAQSVGVSGVTLLLVGTPSTAASIATGVGTAAGVVLAVAAVVVRERTLRDSGELAPYLRAQELIREIGDLDRTLPAALDVEALTTSILDSVSATLPIEHVTLLAPTGGDLAPLASRTGERTADARPLAVRCERLAHAAWTRHDVVVESGAFAWPLAEATVVAGVLDTTRAPRGPALEGALERLERDLATRAVQLDTALLLLALRAGQADAERRRLARELDDGLGQDLAAAGHLVDEIAAAPSAGDVPDRLVTLRGRIGAAVREVRTVVTALREAPEARASLGEAISSAVDQLAETTSVPIVVTVDEGPVRLPRESEVALVRITQEAVTNAVRHSGASVVDVMCRVRAPMARIVVSDDGTGLRRDRPGAGRTDGGAHGLRIMAERASRIGAELSVEDRDTGGVEVVVDLRPAPTEPGEGSAHGDVGSSDPEAPVRVGRSGSRTSTRPTKASGTGPGTP